VDSAQHRLAVNTDGVEPVDEIAGSLLVAESDDVDFERIGRQTKTTAVRLRWHGRLREGARRRDGESDRGGKAHAIHLCSGCLRTL
jgi:hypothetical protein